MKASQFVVAGLICLAASACRTDPNVAILERELRLQEDQLYKVRDCLEDSQAALASCRRENASLRDRLQGGGAASSQPSERGSSGLGSGPRAPAEAAPMAPPAINLGTPEPEGSIPDRLKSQPSAPPLEKAPLPEPRRLQSPPGPSAELLPGPALPGLGESEAPGSGSTAGNAGSGDLPVAKGSSRKVRKIVLNEALTGGYTGRGRDGEAGVMVMIEPRDGQGEFVDAPGDISVVVVDPVLPGDAARVARWDFSAQEVASLFRATALGKGIDLEMPWPAGPPAHTDLHLFVRYTTADGRKLEVQQAIKIDGRRDLSTRWVPSDRPAPPGSTSSAASSSGRTAQTPELRRRMPAAPAHPTRAVRPEAARGEESTPRTAAVPSWSNRREPTESSESLQRPVWSPERE